jgi:hypothetical protein
VTKFTQLHAKRIPNIMQIRSYTVVWLSASFYQCRLGGNFVCSAASPSHFIACFNTFRFLLQHIFQAFIAASKKQHVGSVDCGPSSVLRERLQVMTDILYIMSARVCDWKKACFRTYLCPQHLAQCADEVRSGVDVFG